MFQNSQLIKRRTSIGARADSLIALSGKMTTGLNLFWYGFIIYTTFFGLSTISDAFVSASLCQGFQVLGLVLCIVGGVMTFKFKFDDKYLSSVYSVYMAYSMIIVLRGGAYDMVTIKKMLFSVGLGALPYFAPLVMLWPRNFIVYKKMINILIVCGVLFILFTAVFWNIVHDPNRLSLTSQSFADVFISLLALPLSYIFLTYLYHQKGKEMFGIGKKNLFALFVMILALYLAIYRARRGAIFMLGSSLAVAGMLYFIFSKNRVMTIFMSILVFSGAALFFVGRQMPSMFSFVMERGDEDTRSGVEQYMSADMSRMDWFFGKGIHGEYFCPIVVTVDDASGYRDVIETGFLQILLKGGYTSLLLLLMILVPAIYRGLFKSSNLLAKASAVYILLWLAFCYPSVVVGFMIHYIVLWVAVGICYSEQIRNLPDSTIKYYLQK